MWKESRWVREILALQQPDGLWGYFHTLSEPGKHPITTEQALRRLRILGCTIGDPPIQMALSALHAYLEGSQVMPDHVEKTPDWPIFQRMMPAAWITLFTSEDDLANQVADQWAYIVEAAFAAGRYDQGAYFEAYREQFAHYPAHGRSRDLCHFYLVALLRNRLSEQTAEAFFQHLLHHHAGLYYMVSHPLNQPPPFQSKEASRYLGALELLAEYDHPACRKQLAFASDWLMACRNTGGEWDMGTAAKDGVYFPLSDSWRTATARKNDCTARILAFLAKVPASDADGE